jgi:hypothetical protein
MLHYLGGLGVCAFFTPTQKFSMNLFWCKDIKKCFQILIIIIIFAKDKNLKNFLNQKKIKEFLKENVAL